MRRFARLSLSWRLRMGELLLRIGELPVRVGFFRGVAVSPSASSFPSADWLWLCRPRAAPRPTRSSPVRCRASSRRRASRRPPRRHLIFLVRLASFTVGVRLHLVVAGLTARRGARSPSRRSRRRRPDCCSRPTSEVSACAPCSVEKHLRVLVLHKRAVRHAGTKRSSLAAADVACTPSRRSS